MDLFNNLIKKRIRELERVNNTFENRFDYLRFEKNERLCNFDGELFKKFIKSIKAEYLSGYPSIEGTYKKISNHLGIERNQIFIAAGSDLAIKSIYEACINENDKIILPSYCYAMYDVYSKMFGANAVSVDITDDWNFDIDKMIDEVDDTTKLFVLENPSGTFGGKLSLEDISRCAKFLRDRGVLFLIDEAYSKNSKVNLSISNFIEEFPNVIISRSFSKFCGLAGLRVGFLVGSKYLIENISKVRPMHEITSISALAVEWILDYPELINEYCEVLNVSKKYLEEHFFDLKIGYRDSDANFIFAYLPDNGRTKKMIDKLKKCKILLKHPFKKGCLKGWVRMTVGTIEDSKRLIKEIRNQIEKIEKNES